MKAHDFRSGLRTCAQCGIELGANMGTCPGRIVPQAEYTAELRAVCPMYCSNEQRHPMLKAFIEQGREVWTIAPQRVMRVMGLMLTGTREPASWVDGIYIEHPGSGETNLPSLEALLESPGSVGAWYFRNGADWDQFVGELDRGALEAFDILENGKPNTPPPAIPVLALGDRLHVITRGPIAGGAAWGAKILRAPGPGGLHELHTAEPELHPFPGVGTALGDDDKSSDLQALQGLLLKTAKLINYAQAGSGGDVRAILTPGLREIVAYAERLGAAVPPTLRAQLLQLLDHDAPPGLVAANLATAVIERLDGICNRDMRAALNLVHQLQTEIPDPESDNAG